MRKSPAQVRPLLEIMVTVAVMGVAMVAILGGIWTTLRATDLNTKTSNADAVVRAFAETMSQGCTATAPDAGSATPAPGSDACVGPDNAYHYVPCTTAGGHVTYRPHPTGPIPELRRDGHEDPVPERLLEQSTRSGPTCPATDLGLQRLTLQASGPNNDPALKDTETVTVVKRDASDDVPLGSA